MLKLLTRFSKKEWLLIIIAVGLIALGAWLDISMLPDFTEKIARAISPDILGQPQGNMSDVWTNGAFMLLIALGSILTVVAVGFIAARVSASHSARLREDIFRKVGMFGTSEMKQFSVASLITRSTNDVTQVRMFIAMGMQMMIKAPIVAVWAVIRILGKSRELSLVTITAVVALTIVIVALIFLVLPRFRKIQTLTDKLNQTARENLTGIRVVRAYNAENYEESKFETVNEAAMRNHLFTMRAMGFVMPFIQLLMSGVVLALWWVSSYLINAGDALAPGSVMAFQQISFQILLSFMMLVIIFVLLPRVLISARRITEVLRVKPSITDGESSSPFGGGSGAVEFRGVAFKYPDAEEYILKDINIKIKSGQTVAFIGSTGSGKSTLVNLLPRLYDATEGELLLDGQNVRDYTLEQLYGKVGYVPQTAVVFKGTVKSNVAFGRELTDEQTKHALEIAQLDIDINKETSQGGKNLSGGQKQRLSIARVVARNPQVFIFDDTFSALDFKTDKALREALKQSCAGSTVLIVAQRIGTIMNADNIVVLEEGRIVGQGTHKELLKTCEVYKQIAYSQLSKEELK